MRKIPAKLIFEERSSAVFRYFLFFSFVFCAVAAQASEENIGWVTVVDGASVKLIRGDTIISVKQGTPVFLNDELLTGKDASLTVQFLDNSVITLGESSNIRVTKLFYNADAKRNSIRIKMANGKLRGLLNSLSEEGSEMSVETETVIAGIKGSEMSVWHEDGNTTIAVHEGTGFITTLNEKIKETKVVQAGYMLTVSVGKVLMAPIKITEAIGKELNKLIIIRKDDLIKIYKGGAKIVGEGAELVVDGTKQAAGYTLEGAKVTGTIAQKGVEGAVDLTKKGVEGAVETGGKAANGTIKHSRGFFGWLADKLFFWRKKTKVIEENKDVLPEQTKE